jgi:hypothetical protein
MHPAIYAAAASLLLLLLLRRPKTSLPLQARCRRSVLRLLHASCYLCCR